jgi:hypothetical protein
MTGLGAVISEAIVYHYGRDELLRRLAHPFWFQSFGAVMGMDWHSSTTSVVGALKRGLEPLSSELGIHVCGGHGVHSWRTPLELESIGVRAALTSPHSPPRAGSSPRWAVLRCRTGATSTCTALSSPTTATGRSYSRR